MHKKIALLAFCFLSQWADAEMCPDVHRMQNHLPIGWKMYDSDNGSLLTPEQQTQFIHRAAQFALAEWSNKKNSHNEVHCYYNDKIGSHLQAYLAKKNFTPHLSKTSYWYSVTGSMDCAAGTDKCEFQRYIQPHSQLAKK